MNSSIFEKALRRASMLLAIIALLLPTILLASTQEALAESDLTSRGTTPIRSADGSSEAGNKQYKLTVKLTGEGYVFLSCADDALQNGDSAWISEGTSFNTTIRPMSSGYVATMSATSGGSNLEPEKQAYKIDPDSGTYFGERSDTMPSADVELTVDFTKGVTISFDKGKSNETGVMQSETWKPSETYTIPECSFTASGSKQFVGWKIAELGDPNRVWQPGEKLAVSTDVTLTAQWGWNDPYAIWVGGTKIDADNAMDVLDDGAVNYDPDTCTLTLRENLNPISGTNDGNALIWARDLPLTVVGPSTETGTNPAHVCNASGSSQYGIRVTGNQSLTVSGNIKVSDVTKCGLDAVDYVLIHGDSTCVEASISDMSSTTNTPIHSGSRIRLDNALEITTPPGGKLSDDRCLVVTSDYKPADHVIIQSPRSQGTHTCDWDDGKIAVEPSCTTEGIRVFTCRANSDHTKEEAIPAIEHTSARVKELIKDASCTKPSYYYDVNKCSECGKILTSHLVKEDPIGHTWTKPTYTWKSNNSAVTAERHCTACGAEEKETVRTSSEVTKEPTATKPGEATMTAVFENPVFSTQTKKIAIDSTGDDPEPGAASYKFVSGGGNTWQKGSNKSCDFTLKRTADDQIAFDHFAGILIDSKEVDAKNYTASSGSVIIQLHPAYLETLSLGKHSITVRFDDAPAISTHFKIAAKNTSTDTTSNSSTDASSNSSRKALPGTGDSTPVALPALLALVAGVLFLLASKLRYTE